MPAALSCVSAATAASTVSPATKREAKRRASPFPRMMLNSRGCSLSHRRPVRSIEDGGQGSGVSVKPCAVARLLLEHLARSEARPEALGEALELRDETLGPEVVGVAQRAAAERRKPEAEHRGDVAVARARDDALPDRARRLIQHREDEPLDRLRRARAPVRLRADELVYGGVDAALLPAHVRIEPLSRLAAEATGLHQLGERGRRGEAIPERFIHHPRDLL